MYKAKTIYYKKVDDEGFNARKGWLKEYMKRNNLSLRRKTGLAQKDPPQMINKFVAYVCVYVCVFPSTVKASPD